MTTDTIPARLFAQAKTRAHNEAYFEKVNGTWQASTWKEYGERVERVGRALIALGVEPGDTTSILGFNCPEWNLFHVGSMAVGAAPAGIYTTCSASEIAYIVGHAEAKVILVESAEQLERVLSVRKDLPSLTHVVGMKKLPIPTGADVLSWDEFLAQGDDVDVKDVFARTHALEPAGLATLIYTSGTTGPPKGVMLSHENLAWTAQMLVGFYAATDADYGLSYLPLSHIAEQMATIHFQITSGGAVYFAESLEKLKENLVEVRPTMFFGVPRVWEKLHAGITGKLAEAPARKRAIAEWAMGVCEEVHQRQSNHVRVGRRLGLKYKLATSLITNKVKAALGMDKVRIAISGAAPLSSEVMRFFTGLDLPIYEGYGQSETSAPTAFSRPEAYRIGAVGKTCPGIETRIADDGEILTRGPNIFMGYFKDEAATNAALEDGWLHSGDLGAFDADGFLSITGRKKDLIITAGGKNIAPRNLEDALMSNPLIAQAVVIGDRRKYLTALVTIDDEAKEKFVADRGLKSDDAALTDALTEVVQNQIDTMNKELARAEQVKKFKLLPRAFTVEHGELTPTMKIKRAKVNELYRDEIEQLYAE